MNNLITCSGRTQPGPASSEPARSVVLNIDGDSYQMLSHRARAETTRRAVAST